MVFSIERYRNSLIPHNFFIRNKSYKKSFPVSSDEAEWYDPNYLKRKKLTLTGQGSAQSNLQLQIDIAYATAMQSNFNDIRFTEADGKTLMKAWLENKVDDTSAEIWVKFPITDTPGVERAHYMYYGNGAAASDWDGDGTFLQYHGSATSDYLDSLSITLPNIVHEARFQATAIDTYVLIGIANATGFSDDAITNSIYMGVPINYCHSINESSSTYISANLGTTINTWYKFKFTYNGSIIHAYVDDVEIESGITTNLPDENCGCFGWFYIGTAEQSWAFVRKYTANPPTYEFGNEENY